MGLQESSCPTLYSKPALYSLFWLHPLYPRLLDFPQKPQTSGHPSALIESVHILSSVHAFHLLPDPEIVALCCPDSQQVTEDNPSIIIIFSKCFLPVYSNRNLRGTLCILHSSRVVVISPGPGRELVSSLSPTYSPSMLISVHFLLPLILNHLVTVIY